MITPRSTIKRNDERIKEMAPSDSAQEESRAFETQSTAKN